MHAPRPRIRFRAAVALTALATVATLAVPATAAPPERGSDTVLSIDCALDEAFVGISAVEFESGAFLDVFVETGTGFAFGFTEDVTLDGTSVTGTVALVDDLTGAPVGTATVDATLTAAGPAETFSDRFRDGNVLVRFEDTVTPATVSGSATLEGVLDTTIDLSTCAGRLIEFSFFATNPASFVDRIDERSADCRVEAPGVFGFVSAFESDGQGPFVDVFLDEFDGATVAGFTQDAVFDDTTLAATVELFDIDTGEPVGEGTVDATLTSLGTSVDAVQSPREGRKLTIEEFAVTGTLAIGANSYELLDCFAQDVEGRVRFTDPPRRARPAPNDLPGDAVLLAVPDIDSIDTTGTAEDPEAPCTEVFEDEGGTFEFELPITHTVWYAFEGTGGPVTVDTAGSSIDTIVGVYDAGLTQLACVDDVTEEPDGFSLQAAVTVDTEPGATYLVQVGGFGGDRGRVTVSVD